MSEERGWTRRDEEEIRIWIKARMAEGMEIGLSWSCYDFEREALGFLMES